MVVTTTSDIDAQHNCIGCSLLADAYGWCQDLYCNVCMATLTNDFSSAIWHITDSNDNGNDSASTQQKNGLRPVWMIIYCQKIVNDENDYRAIAPSLYFIRVLNFDEKRLTIDYTKPKLLNILEIL